MMNYEEYKEYIINHIREYLPERYENANISFKRMVKNNDVVLDGLQILEEGSNITPMLYVNASYEAYQSGKDAEEIVAELADRYIEHISPAELYGMNVQISELTNYDSIKDNICCRLVNQTSNRERLAEVPFTPMEDLAVTYHIQVSNGADGIGSIPITQSLMDTYGVDIPTLHNQAMENMEKLSPTVIKPLGDIVSDMLLQGFMDDNNMSEQEAIGMLADIQPPDVPRILCVTNQCGINGAACMVNPEIQQRVGDMLGGDFFVLPSSIHETLVLGKMEDTNFEELQEMVQGINETQVSPEERLSDYIYEYDVKEHTFSRSDRVQQQVKQLQQSQEENLALGDNPVFGEEKAPYHVGAQENSMEEVLKPEIKQHSVKVH